MPEIHVYWKGRVGLREAHRSLFGYSAFDEFWSELGAESARLFSVDELPVATDDFDIYDHEIDPNAFTRQKKDVVIRIDLHDFPARLATAQADAEAIAAWFSERVNTSRAIEWHGRVTVGVRLVYAEMAWATV